jgi:hypothetical protein
MDGKAELPVGSKITLEKVGPNQWKWHINVQGGGLIGQMGPRPLSEAIESARNATTED